MNPQKMDNIELLYAIRNNLEPDNWQKYLIEAISRMNEKYNECFDEQKKEVKNAH